MIARSMFLMVVTAATVLSLSRAARADSQLPPTPTGDQATPGPPANGAGLNVPDHWSTVENGMVIPHPVTMNGRVLLDVAIPYYAKWKGLPDPRGALQALSDYLLLATLSQNPAGLDSKPSTYALRLLPETERGEYACNNAYGACYSAHYQASMAAPGPNLNFWVGSTEVQQRRSRQAFLDDYRDRFLAAAAPLPIELIDVRYLHVSRYYETRSGFMVSYGLPGSHLFYRSTVSQLWFFYETDVDRAGNRQGPLLSALWPIDSEAGHAVRSRGPVPIQHHLTLIEFQADTPTHHWDAMLRLVTTVVYQDPLLEQELYRFTCPVVSSCLAGR